MSTESPRRSNGARVANLKDFATPTLEAVERRRWQLWLMAGFLILSMSAAVTLLSFEATILSLLPDLPAYVVRVLFIGFSILLALYLLDKESKLRDLTHALVDERVLSAALSNRLREVSILSDVGKAMNQVLDLPAVLELILASATDLLEAQEGSVMLVDDKGQNLIIAHVHSDRKEVVPGTVVPIGSGVAGWVALNREPVLILGKATEGHFWNLQPREEAINSSITVPLVGEGELYGVLSVNDLTGDRVFTEYDLRALGLFAEHAALAIRNARVYGKEKQALEQVEEADRMKSEFIATVSHELKTPLTSIIGSAKTLRTRSEELTESNKAQFVEIIERQADRLLAMVEKVLTASSVETGDSFSRRQRVDLTDLLRACVREAEVGHSNPIKLESPERVSVIGDYGGLVQVFSNLLDNACKYSDPDSPVTVRVSDTPDRVFVEVADQGRGIPHSEFEAIFDRFYRADGLAAQTVAGAGLGLYIVKRILDSMDSTVSVRSREGIGSVFTVALQKRSAI